MEWLNYHHLFYFWTVAREGSIARASQLLRLAQPTISGQLRTLEGALGERLFTRVGRHLVMTHVGRVVYDYADGIFTLGRELQDTLKDRPTGRPLRLQVGIADTVHKAIAQRLLRPAFALGREVQVSCREGEASRLVAALATHELDVVIADAPATMVGKTRVQAYPLGECAVSVLGPPALAARHTTGFPESLGSAPFVMHAPSAPIRQQFDVWLAERHLNPQVAAECDDSALVTALAAEGVGLFIAPAVIAAELARRYRLVPLGQIDGVRLRFCAMTVPRRLPHPAVEAITQQAMATIAHAEAADAPRRVIRASSRRPPKARATTRR